MGTIQFFQDRGQDRGRNRFPSPHSRLHDCERIRYVITLASHSHQIWVNTMIYGCTRFSPPFPHCGVLPQYPRHDVGRTILFCFVFFLGIKPRALCRLNTCSTVHPHPSSNYFLFKWKVTNLLSLSHMFCPLAPREEQNWNNKSSRGSRIKDTRELSHKLPLHYSEYIHNGEL